MQISLSHVVGQITAPQEIHVKSPGPLDVTLYGKRYFVSVIRLRVLRWDDYPDGFNCADLYKREAGESERRR